MDRLGERYVGESEPILQMAEFGPVMKRPRQDSEEFQPQTPGRPNGKRQRSARASDGNTGGLEYLVVHEVVCDKLAPDHSHHSARVTFFDTPRLYAGDCRLSPLHGREPVKKPLDEYLETHPNTSFIIIRRYSCEQYQKSLIESFERVPMPYLVPQSMRDLRHYFSVLKQHGPLAVSTGESIRTLCLPLTRAMRQLESHDPKTFSGWAIPQHLESPYIHFYHTAETIKAISGNLLNPLGQAHVNTLLNYLESSFGAEYDEADDLFERGVITLKHLPKLFRTNDIIVSMHDGQPKGFSTQRCHVKRDSVRIFCSTWFFDGAFRQADEQLEVRWPGDADDELPVGSLSAYPLRYDNTGLKDKLLARGKVFWSCRKRRFVSYAPPRRTFEIRIVNPRYMIDMETYKQLHEEKEAENNPAQDDLGDLMDSETPPSDDFMLQLPAQILGFGLHDKKWRYLLVEYIQQINWNKAAFDRLVLDPDKKGLITAMVKEHVLSDTSADIIEGKGNGLIILLHGGPGTGKTLTAESVAELAEKPLYRVTCGDVGTDPEAVEKYLESVLYIGTIWKAVVLFDESDVFLEERSQADLHRNALVSVFLRVLEYYDGILILTSNRVGTFDEAFKSRVQLALHYPAIDEEGRGEIWRDFIQDLERQGADAMFDQLKAKVGALAGYNLNGRQIRNSIRTARQLASQSKEPLSYSHLGKAIKVAQEFEKYVVDTHGGTTHEYYAKEQHIRHS
ncbi:P-loop containing nucleoside triphosphate hydrolase protein [Mariannaea sp. PMI_226]|nr:P-loop containing nucleoside triphosphate hydrolase protein [Mariannaea sp. PMI_226]